MLGKIFGSEDDVCHGRFGEVSTKDGETTQGIEMTCPDGNDYVIPGSKDEAESKAKDEVLRPNCSNDEERRCTETWRAQVFDET